MSDAIVFYQDTPHPCSYLEAREACNIYPDPNQPMTNALYSHLIQYGFRRSGALAYRPHCLNCQACVPVRINTANFTLNRSQRRCLQRNQHLTISQHPASFNTEHYELYCRYLAARHQGGGMDNPTEESYVNFLTSSWSETSFIEIRDEKRLVAVAVTDYIQHGLSALYTFFDPDMRAYSLGTYAILQQINIAKTRGLPWIYLGYWISNCQKMKYKQNFSGIEGYINQKWQALNNEKL
ncbi:MAG: arginyl-tRNA--protein-N-Asp/Glu arginylyltransferase [Methylophagaceae bacterium]|jgi:arginyl-tRNA--protein-N-Asp/Glu arginylyltransferase